MPPHPRYCNVLAAANAVPVRDFVDRDSITCFSFPYVGSFTSADVDTR